MSYGQDLGFLMAMLLFPEDLKGVTIAVTSANGSAEVPLPPLVGARGNRVRPRPAVRPALARGRLTQPRSDDPRTQASARSQAARIVSARWANAVCMRAGSGT